MVLNSEKYNKKSNQNCIIMAKEVEIDGRKYRCYRFGGVWIDENGYAAYKEDKIYKRLYVKTEADGHKYIFLGGKPKISMALAVITCYCKPKPIDGRTYEIEHIDRNLANCKKGNLRWVLKHYEHTSAKSVTMKQGKDKITVKKDGTIFLNGKEEQICDSMYDSDIDLEDCIRPHISTGMFGTNHIFVDDLMEKAGYVQGDDAILNDPVILHKDYDWMNFSSDNLEWVESTDQRYKEYCEKIQETKKRRRRELNPGKQLYPGW